MAAKHIGLGRGLGALIKDSTPLEKTPEKKETGTRVPLSAIRKSPWQPRHQFNEESLAELIQSVRERGVLQPLLVRKVGDTFELIAGERRYRAATEAGLMDVPVIIMDVGDREALELALVENLQRADLNMIEEAEGYKVLAEKFGMTQEQVAERVGKARPSVANALRLLDLPDSVKRKLAEGKLSTGHAKVLLSLEIPREQELLADRILDEGLSVRTVERIISRLKRPAKKKRAEKEDIPPEHLQYILDQVHHRLGTSVRITPCKTLANGKKTKGCIEIDFFSGDDLDRIMVIMGLSDSL